MACAVGLLVTVGAAELPDAAARAFDAYFENARSAFVAAATTQDEASAAREATPLRGGKTIAEPGSGDGIVEAPSSLIHHWRGRTLVPGVTLDQVLAASRDYASYPKIYPQIQRAKVLSDDGATVRIQLRMRASGGGLSATLDVWSRAQYVQLDRRRAYVVSRSESIREVTDAGQPSERLLPEGRDSGYLWRAGAFTRNVVVEQGVLLEMETIGLSRPLPRGLGWIIEPIARRIGRRSVEQSLQEFREAVLQRSKLAP